MEQLTGREHALLRYALHRVWVSKSIKQSTKDEAHEMWYRLFEPHVVLILKKVKV